MRIYCDIDDILSRTAEALLVLAKREFARTYAYEDITDFNLQRTFGFSDEEMKRFSRLSHLYENLIAYEPIEGAVEGLKKLKEAGHTIDLVTGRPSYCHEATHDWLQKVGLGNFPVLYVDKYNRPEPVGEGLPRTIPIEEFLNSSYDIAIDDSPLALRALETWLTTRIFVFDRPWNRAYRHRPNMTCVSSWTRIVAEILDCAG